jgi:hypothetical protein
VRSKENDDVAVPTPMKTAKEVKLMIQEVRR